MFSFSIGLSASSEHFGFESQLLEVAIRTNDVVKVKQFLTIHRDKFQVSNFLRFIRVGNIKNKYARGTSRNFVVCVCFFFFIIINCLRTFHVGLHRDQNYRGNIYGIKMPDKPPRVSVPFRRKRSNIREMRFADYADDCKLSRVFL